MLRTATPVSGSWQVALLHDQAVDYISDGVPSLLAARGRPVPIDDSGRGAP